MSNEKYVSKEELTAAYNRIKGKGMSKAEVAAAYKRIKANLEKAKAKAARPNRIFIVCPHCGQDETQMFTMASPEKSYFRFHLNEDSTGVIVDTSSHDSDTDGAPYVICEVCKNDFPFPLNTKFEYA